MIQMLPTDYLWFWIVVAVLAFIVELALFIPIYLLLSAILREIKK